jgi:predicted amidophosphoribosyltransferase
MGDPACYRRFCPDCDAHLSLLEDRCPDCGAPIGKTDE